MRKDYHRMPIIEQEGRNLKKRKQTGSGQKLMEDRNQET